MGKLSWNPAYVPGEFDKIREGSKEEKHEKRISNAWRMYLTVLVFIAIDIALFCIFAPKASAMDTVTNADLTKQNCGWDVCQNNGTKGAWGDNGDGEAFRYETTQGLKVSFLVNNQTPYSGQYNHIYLYDSNNALVRDITVPKAHYNYGRGGAYVLNDFGDYIEFAVRWEENYYWDNYEIVALNRFFAKKDGSFVTDLGINEFVANRNGQIYRVVPNSTTLDLVYYKFNADQTWTENTRVPLPGVWDYPATIPRYVDAETFTPGSVQPIFQYKGNDDHYYVLLPFASEGALSFRMDTGEYSNNSLLSWFQDWFGQSAQGDPIPALKGMIPVGVIEPADNNILTISAKSIPGYLGPGSLGLESVTGALQTRGVTIAGYFQDESSRPLAITGFVNPKLYFLRENGTYAVWDVSCVKPFYSSCQNFSGQWKCADSLGNQDPDNISCNAPLEINGYYPGGGGSSSGGGGSSSGGGNCTGSGCLGGGTGSGAVSGFSDFIDYVTNCDDDGDGSVSLTEGITCPVFAIGRFFKGFFDRISAGWAGTWSLLEELMKVGTKTETSGTGGLFGFDFDFIETANAESGGLHIDNPMATAFKNSIENNVASDDIFQKIRRYVIASLYLLAIVVIIGLFFSLRRKK